MPTDAILLAHVEWLINHRRRQIEQPRDVVGQTLVRAVVGQDTPMGAAMLFGLVGLLLTAWIGLTVKTRKRIRRSQRDDKASE